MKIFFILGRNPNLSKAEVLSYLEARNAPHKEIVFKDNILILDIKSEPNIQEFGGVMKIGKIDFEGSIEDLENYINAKDIIPSDKFSYAVFGNLDPEPLKIKFKSEKRKAVLKHGRTRIQFQDGSKAEMPKANYYLFLYQNEGDFYFGNVSQSYDSKEVAKRDMEKPVRREHLAISPRLSKVLINLSGAKRGDLILDPFCGVGGILQEALIKGIRVHGVDNDRRAIDSAKKNLMWLYKQYKIRENYKLETKDSRNIEDLNFDAIATETPLGTVVKKRPREGEAKKIISDFERLITPILANLAKVKKPKAKIAITFPRINDIKVDANQVAENANLKVIIEPILESRPDQFISREIIVFE